MDLFSTMLNTKLTREKVSLAFQRGTPCEVSAQIGLFGKASGLVLLSFPEETAIRSAGAMASRRFFRINDDVLDAIGEMANIITGGAKAKMADHDISITPPKILRGQGRRIGFPANCQPVQIWFDSEFGRFCLMAGLTYSGAAGAVDESDALWAAGHDDRRGAARYGVRQTIEVTFRVPMTPPRTTNATTLDISSQSISFLHRGMVHQGTPCAITMTAEDGSKFTVEAKVARSEYLKNSLHLVAAHFGEEIDLTRLFAFHEGAPAS